MPPWYTHPTPEGVSEVQTAIARTDEYGNTTHWVRVDTRTPTERRLDRIIELLEHMILIHEVEMTPIRVPLPHALATSTSADDDPQDGLASDPS